MPSPRAIPGATCSMPVAGPASSGPTSVIGSPGGVDVVRYDGFPAEGRFVEINGEAGAIPLPDASFDVVAAVETIEHIDGPRRFVADLVRLIRRAAWLAITTPSAAEHHSLLSLLLRGYFAAFAEAPASTRRI